MAINDLVTIVSTNTLVGNIPPNFIPELPKIDVAMPDLSDIFDVSPTDSYDIVPKNVRKGYGYFQEGLITEAALENQYDAMPDVDRYYFGADIKPKLPAMHLPGHNYAGPFTDLIDNLIREVIPVDDADFIAMEHDYDYLMANNVNDVYAADIKFANNAQDFESKTLGAILLAKHELGGDNIFWSREDRITEKQKQHISKQFHKVKSLYENWKGGS